MLDFSELGMVSPELGFHAAVAKSAGRDPESPIYPARRSTAEDFLISGRAVRDRFSRCCGFWNGEWGSRKSRWQMANGRWQMANGKWQMANAAPKRASQVSRPLAGRLKRM